MMSQLGIILSQLLAVFFAAFVGYLSSNALVASISGIICYLLLLWLLKKML